MNHQYQPYNYGYYQNVNTMPVPNSEQISYITPQSQLNLTSEGPLQQQPYKTNQQKTPQQNRTSLQTTTCQNILQYNIPHQLHHHENTSTPTQTEQDQDYVMNREKDDSQQITIVAANKRALNDSDEFVTVSSNKSKKKVQKKDQMQDNQNQQSQNQQITIASGTNKNQNKYSIPMDQLQRAVAHNLPCFSISFSKSENLPSAVAASEELYEHFERRQIKLSSGFSVVRYIGNQLKVGVNNKADYQILCNQKVWPSEIQSNQISVHLPKFTPEQFSLVVRYIPPELSVEQVTKEVKRSASTADNFRKIVYSYARKTNDFRFTVSDIKEYNGLLRLGHIGIANRMQIVTPYRPANKLTYCSKCWHLGHLRNQCPVSVQKCRFCLLDYNANHNDICSKQFKCAQCSLNHFSLDADCQMIQQHRNNLNQAVKQAVKEGAIKFTSLENAQSTPIPPPMGSTRIFQPLTTTASNQITAAAPRWVKTATATATQKPLDITNQQLLEQLRAHMDEKSKQLDVQIIKLEKEFKSNEKSITEVRRNLTSIVGTFKLLMQEIIQPILKSIPINEDKTLKIADNILLLLDSHDALQENEIYKEDKQPEVFDSSTIDQQQVQLSTNLIN
jgi:hypothetical protein